MHEQVLIEFTPKQQEFAEAVFSGKYSYLLFGGAIRGGKSYSVLGLLIALCRVYPGSRWAVVRRDLPTLRRNTIPTFEKIKPHWFGDINRSIWTVRCTNGSEILFFPETLKSDPDLDRWKGLEVNGFVLEEANELSESSFNKSIERAGSWSITAGNQPPPLVLMTCNPAKNWVKRLFYDKWKTGALNEPFFYLPARVTDNPHLPKSYLRSLENLELTDPRAYKRFVLGDWESADDPDQLIRFEWVLAARNVERIPGKKRLGVDVARYGDDDTVLCHIEGNTVTQLEYFQDTSIDRTAAIVQTRINEGPIDADKVNIDTVGLGAGVADILIREGYEVTEIVSGAKANEDPTSFYKFRDLRSQLWWHARESLRNEELCIDIEDHRLIEDLTAPRYSVTGDKVLKVESKDEIRKRIGRSTDAADALIYALADLGTIDYRSISISEAGVRENPWVI